MHFTPDVFFFGSQSPMSELIRFTQVIHPWLVSSIVFHSTQP